MAMYLVATRRRDCRDSPFFIALFAKIDALNVPFNLKMTNK